MGTHSHGHHAHDHANGTDRFSDEAAGWDEKPGHAERARAVAALLRESLPLRPDTAVLEIGGGTGLLSRSLVDDIGTATVTDLAPGMVEAARTALDDPRYEGWQAELLDIEHDDLPEKRYDLVLGLLALHHMGDVESVVGRCASVLRPGGHLALVDLDHDPEGAFHAHVDDFDGHDGFTRDDVARWLTQAGLGDVRVSDAGVVKEEAAGQERDFPMFLAVGRHGKAR